MPRSKQAKARRKAGKPWNDATTATEWWSKMRRQGRRPSTPLERDLERKAQENDRRQDGKLARSSDDTWD